jgi:hypothetical protein
MAISVVIEDEGGNTIDGPWVDDLCTKALERPGEETKCLRYIDPYGDTVFNQLQIPALRAELADQWLKVKDRALENTLDSLIQFLQRADDRVHTYVRFIGD